VIANFSRNRTFSSVYRFQSAEERFPLIRLGCFQASDAFDRLCALDFETLAPARNLSVPLALHSVQHCVLDVSEARGRERFALIYRRWGWICGLHGTRSAIVTAEAGIQRAGNSGDKVAKCGHGFSNLFRLDQAGVFVSWPPF
jgi:hypothetical protein